MKAQELLSDKRKWTKGVFARNHHGISCSEYSDVAAQFCLIGAVKRCYPEPLTLDAVMKCHEAAMKLYGKNPIDINENMEYEDVIKILKEANV